MTTAIHVPATPDGPSAALSGLDLPDASPPDSGERAPRERPAAGRDAGRPLRVCHVVGRLGRGRAQVWLTQLLEHIDRADVRFDFVVHSERAWPLDREVQALGARIIRCPRPRSWSYARRLSRILHHYGPYDAVHSHLHYFNGRVLRLAHRAGVSRRIAHGYDEPGQTGAGTAHLVRWLGRRWIRAHATRGFATRRAAARALFGDHWEADRRWGLLPISTSLDRFRVPSDSQRTREALRVPPEALVLGHVGDVADACEYEGFLRVMRRVARRAPEVFAVMAGSIACQERIRADVRALGLDGRVRFVGIGSDLARLMRDGMDVLLLPSHVAGMPMPIVEAQAAGLPAVVADSVSSEVVVVRELIQRLPVSAPIDQWAEAALTSRERAAAVDQKDALRRMEQSPFNIRRSIQTLVSSYSPTDRRRATRRALPSRSSRPAHARTAARRR